MVTSRLIGLDDLPVARAEIELTEPGTELVLAEGPARPRKIMALVRLHSHPLGVVVLDGTCSRWWRTYATTIWDALGGAINAHLVADGLPPLNCLDLAAGLPASESPPRCLRRRVAALRQAPLVTVIVATRERPESLRICLEVLLELDYPTFEIVVVDNDPSTGETAAMIERRFGPLVRYVREDRRGLAAAHNRGLEEARGEIVAFVDDDVVTDRHWLSAIVEGFTAAGDVGCVTGLILPAQLETPAQVLLERHGSFDKGFELRIFDTGGHRPDDPLFPFTAGRLGSGANMAFATKLLGSLRGFDPATGVGTFARGGDDLAAFFRVIVSGYRLVYQPSALVWHRHRRDMASLGNQAYGYGVGTGAYLASALMDEPRMLPAFLRRIPAGLAYAFSSSSTRNRDRYQGWSSQRAALERRGVLLGPAAYLVSRWRTRGAIRPSEGCR